MKIRVLYFVACLLLAAGMIHAEKTVIDSTVVTTENKQLTNNKKQLVYLFNLEKEIGPQILRQMQQAFKEANNISADIILIHMNTYGGEVTAADSMRTKILHSKIPVYVFIDNNAASAGALISIACDSIYMRSGANIGAATVVTQTGEAAPDKYQSYMRSMMRSTAEETGRDPHIAEAMVDQSIYIKGITDSGRVVTFTTSEAIKYGFCEGKAESIEEVLKLAKIDNYTIKEYKVTTLESIIGFFINPFVSGILIMIIIGGIYLEFQTPGAVFPIVAAAIAVVLYFTPLYLEGLVEHWEFLLFIAGLGLLALEIFVVPGFGVTGISGIILMVAALTISLIPNKGFDFSMILLDRIIISLMISMFSMPIGLIISFYLGHKLLTSKGRFSYLALHSEQNKEEGYTIARKEEQSMIGRVGVAFTVLRPGGKVMIDDTVFDATSEGGFIDKGESVKVIRYESMQLYVRKNT